jgi:hypothetical protein
MRTPVLVAMLTSLAAFTAGCIHATPVTPAPLAADKAAQLETALVGRWILAEEQEVGGARKSASGGQTTFTFGADRTLVFKMEGPFGPTLNYTITLDGANLSTTPKWMDFRVDGWSADTLDLFVYSMSRHWYFKRG